MQLWGTEECPAVPGHPGVCAPGTHCCPVRKDTILSTFWNREGEGGGRQTERGYDQLSLHCPGGKELLIVNHPPAWILKSTLDFTLKKQSPLEEPRN